LKLEHFPSQKDGGKGGGGDRKNQGPGHNRKSLVNWGGEGGGGKKKRGEIHHPGFMVIGMGGGGPQFFEKKKNSIAGFGTHGAISKIKTGKDSFSSPTIRSEQKKRRERRQQLERSIGKVIEWKKRDSLGFLKNKTAGEVTEVIISSLEEKVAKIG